MGTPGVKHPNSFWARNIDIAKFVYLHTVNDTACNFSRSNVLRKNAVIGQFVIGCDVENSDICSWRVVDIEQLFSGRKTQPVRLPKVTGQELWLPAVRWHSINATKVELHGTLNAKSRQSSIARVGEDYRVIRSGNYVIGTVQFLVLVMRSDNFHLACWRLPNNAAICVLAYDE